MDRPAVLVVDDDFETRESMVDLLLNEGFDALSAKDGRDGMLELRMRPDVRVILLDLTMPMMGGQSFRDEQLADPALAAIPVIVISGDENYAAAAAEFGAKSALKKPCSLADLRTALAEYR